MLESILQNPINPIFQVDDSYSRLDEIGDAFMNDPDKVSPEEAEDLLVDMLHVDALALNEHLDGRQFVPVLSSFCEVDEGE